MPGDGYAADNVPCNCMGMGEKKPGKHRRSFFSSISHIIDDCLASGVTVYCVRMQPAKREYMLRQLASVRKRPPLPGREHWVCGVPVIADEKLRAPFIVVTDET